MKLLFRPVERRTEITQVGEIFEQRFDQITKTRPFYHRLHEIQCWIKWVTTKFMSEARCSRRVNVFCSISVTRCVLCVQQWYFSHRTNDSHKLDLLVSFFIIFFMTASFHLEAWCRPLKLGLSRHIHWSACTKPGKWVVMYLCVRGIDFVSFSTIFLLDFGAVPKVR